MLIRFILCAVWRAVRRSDGRGSKTRERLLEDVAVTELLNEAPLGSCDDPCEGTSFKR